MSMLNTGIAENNLTLQEEKPYNPHNSSYINSLGFSVKGIRAEGKCPVCKKPFHFNGQKGFVCPEHFTIPQRFTIDFHYKGKRIRRGTTIDGKTLRTFADAHALLVQAENEKERKKFNLEKWQSKERIDFRFYNLVYKWYEEKEELMKQGKRAYGYVPKLKTYIDLNVA